VAAKLFFAPAESAYIHIPFCRRRCYYCDFPVSVVGDRPPLSRRVDGTSVSGSGTIAHYVDMLCQEICLTPFEGNALKTVFFGGGTPSLLSVSQLHQILDVLEQRFGLVTDAEISMEIDPGTFDRAKLQGYRAAGVNRVSLGAQAFQPELLTASGRSHTVEQIEQAVAVIQQVDLTNFSLDLISGLPHQTPEHWQASLERAIALAPAHLSCYDLTVEAGTPFSRQYKPGMHPLPSDETTAQMYRTAQHLLTSAGYDHYEISNYARPGFQCRHNRVYWENRPFYGFGMGATSYIDGDRRSRPRKTREYYDWLGEQEQNAGRQTAIPSLSRTGCRDAQSEETNELLLDTLMLGLRLAEGVDLAKLQEQFGASALERIWHCLKPYHQQGWVTFSPSFDPAIATNTPPTTGRLQLTDPEGLLFSNIVLVALFEAFNEPLSMRL